MWIILNVHLKTLFLQFIRQESTTQLESDLVLRRKQPYRWNWNQPKVLVSSWPWPKLSLSYFHELRIFVILKRFLSLLFQCWFSHDKDFMILGALITKIFTFQHSTISPILISTWAKNFGSTYFGPSPSGYFFSASFFSLGLVYFGSLAFFYSFFFYYFLGSYFCFC